MRPLNPELEQRRAEIKQQMDAFKAAGGKIKSCTSEDNAFQDQYTLSGTWLRHKDKRGPEPMAIHRSSKYPWAKLEIGQSFWIGGKEPKYMADQAREQHRRHARVYECRSENGGTRVTRVK